MRNESVNFKFLILSLRDNEAISKPYVIIKVPITPYLSPLFLILHESANRKLSISILTWFWLKSKIKKSLIF